MAVKKFIDSTGLATLWEKVKALIPGIATSSKAGIVKSGGDVTVASDGVVSVNDNSHNHFYEKGVFYGASGTGGYINFCTITVNAQYKNEPFSLELSSRSRLGTLTINLNIGASTTITAPSLVWTSDLIEAAPVWYKVDGNKLYLYWQKSEAYDEMTVTGLNVGLYTYKGVTFSWGNTYVTATTGLTNVPKSGYKVTCLNFNSENASGYTIDSFWVSLLYYSGCVGSVYLSKKSSGVGSDIIEGWYNFVYMPYGNGASVAGFRSYGSIILTPMTMSTSSWVLRVTNSSSTVTEAVKLTKYSIADISGLQAALDGKSSTSHSHGLSTNNFYQLLNNTTTDSGQSMVGVTNSSGFNLLKAVRGQGSAPAWFQPDYSAGIAFGGGDTKGIMSMRYQLPSIRFAGGNGGQFKWNMTISGTSGTTYDLSKLATKADYSKLNNGVLNITGSNRSSYYNSSTGTLTIPNDTELVCFSGYDFTSSVSIKSIVFANGSPVNGRRLALLFEYSDSLTDNCIVSGGNINTHVFSHGYMYQYVKYNSNTYNITKDNGCCAAAFKEFIFWNGKWFDGGYTTPDYADENNYGGLVRSGNHATISNGYITIPRLNEIETELDNKSNISDLIFSKDSGNSNDYWDCVYNVGGKSTSYYIKVATLTFNTKDKVIIEYSFDSNYNVCYWGLYEWVYATVPAPDPTFVCNPLLNSYGSTSATRLFYYRSGGVVDLYIGYYGTSVAATAKIKIHRNNLASVQLYKNPTATNSPGVTLTAVRELIESSST